MKNTQMKVFRVRHYFSNIISRGTKKYLTIFFLKERKINTREILFRYKLFSRYNFRFPLQVQRQLNHFEFDIKIKKKILFMNYEY